MDEDFWPMHLLIRSCEDLRRRDSLELHGGGACDFASLIVFGMGTYGMVWYGVEMRYGTVRYGTVRYGT